MQEKREFKSYHGATIYVISIVGLIIVSLIFGFVIEGTGLKKGDAEYNTLSLIAAIFLQISSLAVFLLYTKRRNVMPNILFNINKDYKKLLKHILAAFIFYLICITFFYPINFTFFKLLEKIGYNLSDSFSFNSVLDIIILSFATIIAAPIMEELIYRGCLLSGLNKRFGNIKSAIFCGIAFSLMHMNPQQTVYQFFLGTAAAFLAISSGSIIPSIILHALNNVVAILYSFMPFINVTFNSYEALLSKSILPIFAIVFTVIGIGLIFIVNKFYLKLKDTDKESREVENESAFFTMFILGLAICIFMWLTQFNFSLI